MVTHAMPMWHPQASAAPGGSEKMGLWPGKESHRSETWACLTTVIGSELTVIGMVINSQPFSDFLTLQSQILKV